MALKDMAHYKKFMREKGGASTCKMVSSWNAPQGVEYVHTCTWVSAGLNPSQGVMINLQST